MKNYVKIVQKIPQTLYIMRLLIDKFVHVQLQISYHKYLASVLIAADTPHVLKT